MGKKQVGNNTSEGNELLEDTSDIDNTFVDEIEVDQVKEEQVFQKEEVIAPVKEVSPKKHIVKNIDWFLAYNRNVRKDGKEMDFAFRAYCKQRRIFRFEGDDAEKKWIRIYNKFKNKVC